MFHQGHGNDPHDAPPSLDEAPQRTKACPYTVHSAWLRRSLLGLLQNGHISISATSNGSSTLMATASVL